MKFFVYHYRGEEMKIPGVYQEGNIDSNPNRPAHWIKIPEDRILTKLLSLAQDYEVWIKNAGPIPSLIFDTKGYGFKQR